MTAARLEATETMDGMRNLNPNPNADLNNMLVPQPPNPDLYTLCQYTSWTSDSNSSHSRHQ